MVKITDAMTAPIKPREAAKTQFDERKSTSKGTAMIRLEIDTIYNCRAKKGERRAPDRSGRLLKTTIIYEDGLDAALNAARQMKETGERIAPGYSEVMEIRAYDRDQFLQELESGRYPEPLYVTRP